MDLNFTVDTSAVGEPPGGAVQRAAPSGVGSGSVGYSGGGPVWLDAFRSKRPPTPPELVNAYKSIAFACIQLNAKGVTKVPLRLYAKTGSGQRKPRRSYAPVPDARQRWIRGRADFARTLGPNDDVDEITDHPLLEALERPNPYFDRPTLLGYLVACLDAVGSAFIAPTRPSGPDGLGDPAWAPSELWPLQPQYVFPVKGLGADVLRCWRYFGDTFEPKELVRVRHVSLRDPYLSAYAPLHASYEQNGLVDYYTASVEGILKGGAMPAGIVGPSDPQQRWGNDEVKRLDADINNSQTGPRKGKWWVTSGAFNAKTLTFSPVDLGGLELTKEQRLLAANCFDVPISLLQNEDSNRATARESTHQHQYYGIAPRCSLIDSALTQQLARPIDERLFFAFDNPVARDRDTDAKVFDMALRNNTRTINEVRAEEGLSSVEWGEGPFDKAAAAAPTSGEPDGDEAQAGKPAAHGQAEDVQRQALNGAQITSLVEVCTGVRSGVIPPETAKAVLAAAFPAIDPAAIDRIVNPIKVDPTPEPAPEPPARPGQPQPQPDPGEPEPDPADAERSAVYRRFFEVLDRIESSVPGPGDDDPAALPAEPAAP